MTDNPLRAALRDIQDWLMQPDRAYSPHEIATETYDRIAAALAASATEEPRYVRDPETGHRVTTEDGIETWRVDYSVRPALAASATDEPT